MIYDITAEHTEITFIEKVHLQVSISGCCNIISRYRIHDNFHGSTGSCFYQHVDAEIHRRPVVLFGLMHIGVVFDGYKKSRDQIFEQLAQYNIHARKYFYPCVNHYDCYRERFDERETPVAAQVSRQVLTLPLYADLEPDVVDLICDLVLE